MPITIDLGEGSGTLRVLTHHVSVNRITIELGAEDVVPPNGCVARFRADIAGRFVTGEARVRGTQAVETNDGRMLLLELDVSRLDDDGVAYLRRSAFRDLVLRYAERNPEGKRILQTADSTGPAAPTAPDTRPVCAREGRWVEGTADPLPRSERSDQGLHNAPGSNGGRKRPKPGRHTWDLEDRFRSR